MTVIEAPGPRREVPRAVFGLAALASVAGGLVLGLILGRVSVPLGLALALGLALVAALALAVVSEDTAVLVAFALLGVVVVEPAPCDGLLAVVMVVAAVRGRSRVRRLPPPAFALASLLLALEVVSTIGVDDPGRAASFMLITVYLVLLGFWLPHYVVSSRRARVLLVGYLIAAVTSTLLGAGALFLHIPGSDTFSQYDRARGLFQDPNVFGPFLVPAALAVLEELVHPRLLRLRPSLKAVLLLVLVAGVVLSYSRGAWLNLAVGLVAMVTVLSLRRGGGRTALKVVGVLLVAATATAAVVVTTGSLGFLEERARPQTYDANRFSGQRAGIEAGLASPLGIGPGQYEKQVDIAAHSTYARVIAEQGLIGIMVLLALWLYTAGTGLGNALTGRDTYGIGSVTPLGAWCGMLVNSLVVDTLHWRHLWIVAALIWAGRMRPPPR